MKTPAKPLCFLCQGVKKTFYSFVSLLILSLVVNASFAQIFVQEEFVARYNGPDSLSDIATAIDVNGNIYVTGVSQIFTGVFESRSVILKYNPAGVLQWAVVSDTSIQSNDIVVDEDCNVYITGINQLDVAPFDFNIYTVKYNTNAVLQWEVVFDGGNLKLSDAGSAIALDQSGNVYITGTSEGNTKITTIKYDSTGNQQWVVNNRSGIGSDIEIDNSGNVYITGTSGGNLITIKYNTGGTEQWFAQPVSIFGFANALALDNSGNVYITGGIFTPDIDFITIKYNNSGVQQWLQTYDGPVSLRDVSEDIVVDNNGNVYITGGSAGDLSLFIDFFGDTTIFSISDFATIKYSTSGVQLWVQRFNGPGNDEDKSHALVLDANNNVYVTGSSTGNGTGLDYSTLAYDSSGIFLWEQRYNGPANSFDEANSIAIDTAGNVYITGRSLGVNTNFDFATIKYSQSLFPPTQLSSGDCDAIDVLLAQTLTADLVLGATGYEFLIENSSLGFSTTFISGSNGELPLIVIIGLERGVTYDITVRTIFNLDTADFGPVCTITIFDDFSVFGIVYDRFGNTYTIEDITITPGTEIAGMFKLFFENDPNGAFTPNVVKAIKKVFREVSTLIVQTPCNNDFPLVNMRIVAPDPSLLCPGAIACASAFYIPLDEVCADINVENTGIIYGSVWRAINTGFNDPTLFDGQLDINFADFNFNIDTTNATTTGTQIDLYSVVLHEIIHTLGFASLIRNDGTSMLSTSVPPAFFFSRFDTYLVSVNDANAELITWDGEYSAVFNGAGQITSVSPPDLILFSGCNNIRFQGNFALDEPIADYGAVPPGNLSHWDPACSPSGIMRTVLGVGVERRTPDDADVNVLLDLGYEIDGTFGDGTEPHHNLALPFGGPAVFGIDDGFPPIKACASRYVLELCNPGTDNITISDFLNNDISTADYTGLQLVQGTGTFVEDQVNNEFTYTPIQTELAVFRYIPLGAGGEIGNYTCIRIEIVPCDPLGLCFQPDVCNQICNPVFAHPTCPLGCALICAFDLDPPPSWTYSHGTADWQDCPRNQPNPGYARLAAISTSCFWSEGILTNVNIIAGNDYIFSYFRRKAGDLDLTTPMDHVFVRLLDAADAVAAGVPGPIDEYCFPGVPPLNQLILQEDGILDLTWEQVVVCFTANANYDRLWIYTQFDVVSPWVSAAVFIDQIELIEDNFSAGPDQTFVCGNVTIGADICEVTNTSYEWIGFDQFSNPIVDNLGNPVIFGTSDEINVTVSSTTTFQVSRSFPDNPLTVIFPATLNNCNATDQVSITATANLSATVVTAINPTCDGASDGSIDLIVSGGTSPYIFLWFPGGETTENLTNIAAGTYDVTVTDDNGCIVTLSVTINDPGIPCVACEAVIHMAGLYPSNPPFQCDCDGPCGVGATLCPGDYVFYAIFTNMSPTVPIVTGSTLEFVVPPFLTITSIIDLCTSVQKNLISPFNTSPVQFLITDPNGIPPQSSCMIQVFGQITNFSTCLWDISSSISGPNCNFQTTQTFGDCNVAGGPLDPNHKQVIPVGCGDPGFITNQVLTYIVRFQNVGTGLANNVILRDTIDDNLDLNSIQVLSSTHTITSIQVSQPDRELVITFQGIELPPLIFDTAGSVGAVKYSITPLPNLPNGTPIINSTGIFFDTLAPIITNTVINTIVDNPVVTVDAGSDQTVFLGYPPEECADLSATATGAFPPYSFLWSTGETTQDITVCPSVTTDFTVIADASGCLSEEDTVTVNVEDVRCGNNNNKVLICHIPPGNPSNAHTICISPNAVPAHLANHGDFLGSCIDTTQIDTTQIDSLNFQVQFSQVLLTSHPNPLSQSTIITFLLPEPGMVTLTVPYLNSLEIVKLFEGYAEANTFYTVEFDARNLSSGIYFYQLITTTGIYTKKLVIIK